MESWRHVWRKGFAPTLSIEALKALRDALDSDDRRLIQGATTSPPPLPCVQDRPCEGACMIGLAGWLGDGADTVAEVEQYFGERCFEADQLVGEPVACRHMLNWFDYTPRDEMRMLLLPEVELAIQERTAS